jgi:HTH-type transcriptional regulator, competence development regulator
MLSIFGKTVRKLRIDKGVTLKAMADTLGKSSAHLSAVETGRKNPPIQLVKDIALYFSLSPIETQELEQAAQESRTEISLPMTGYNDTQRKVAAAFARQFAKLTKDELNQIRALLEKKNNS